MNDKRPVQIAEGYFEYQLFVFRQVKTEQH